MDKKIQKANDLAYNYYQEYGTCSQCVIAAMMEVMEIDLSNLVKSAHFLAGGGCLMGEGTCGALAGGELVLGHYFGREREEFAQGKFRERLLPGKELWEKFKLEFGGTSCNWFKEKYTGKQFDMWNNENVAEYKKLMKQECATMTGKVAGWIVELILQSK
ncbi:MAG: C-GCAxxG-C-C family protein [Candidatus Cloacimonetes bacterium]|nr:C-GCAxxG-C-C family protein [Candidatus Cloacimonadota bacterium]